MLYETLAALAALLTTTVAKDALTRAIETYKAFQSRRQFELHSENVIVTGDKNVVIDSSGIIIGVVVPKEGEEESPIEASRSTKEVIQVQLTILEAERNRLIPIATREHWVALVFAIIAGIVFFTSVGLVIFATLGKAIAMFVASAVPGFLSRVFFTREANMEKRLKEISSDLRESEKVKERLEILEEALTVIPEEFRARVLEDFTKKPAKLVTPKT